VRGEIGVIKEKCCARDPLAPGSGMEDGGVWEGAGSGFGLGDGVAFGKQKVARKIPGSGTVVMVASESGNGRERGIVDGEGYQRVLARGARSCGCGNG